MRLRGAARPQAADGPYHLKLLTDAGLLQREKRGSFAYYRLAAGALERLGDLVAAPPALTRAV